MITVSKNMKRGAQITDLNELVQLAEDKCSVVIYMNRYTFYVRPAAFILNWQLCMILRVRIYNCLPIKKSK